MKPDPNPAYRRFRDYRPPSTVDRIVAFSAVFIIFAALLLAARAAFALPFAMRLAFCGQSTSSSSSLANLAYPENYVQDGLVCMYDGKWNAGWGRHDSTATTWRNIGSGGSQYDAVYSRQKNVAPQWGDDYLHMSPSNSCFYINCARFLPTVIPTNWTVECVAKDEYGRYSRSESGLVGLFDKTTYETEDGYEAYYCGLSFGTYYSGKINGSNLDGIFFGVGTAYSTAVIPSPYMYCSPNAPEYKAVSYSLSCEGGALDSDEIARTMRGYRNGKSFGSNGPDNGLSLNNPGYFCIGNSRSADSSFHYNYIGCIYVVRIYNRTLTDEEVAHNYVVDAARFGLPYDDPTATR